MSSVLSGRAGIAVLFGLGAALASMLFCSWYVHVEHPAYLWDYGAYWSIYRNLGASIASGSHWWPSFVAEIAQADYNPSATLPLMPAYLLFGGGRRTYVEAVAVLYLIPTCLCAAALSGAFEQAKHRLCFCLILALLFTPFWAPTLRGMLDIVGLIPLGLAALLLFRTRCLREAHWTQVVALGVLLWCPFLLRRWYVFSIVALIAVCGATALVELLWTRASRAAFVRTVGSYAVAGLIALSFIVDFQRPLLQTIIGTSYVGTYAAYQQDLTLQLQLYLGRFGAFLLILSLLGNVKAVAAKDWRVIRCTLVALLAFLLFSRVQAPGVHHSLPVAFFLFPSYYLGASTIAATVSGAGGWLTMAVLAMLNFASTVVPGDWGAAALSGTLFPSERVYPLHLDNYAEYRRLISDLERLPQGATFVVFASSTILSDSLLGALEPALQPRIVWASQVDRKDHFDLKTLQADYALIATPTLADLSVPFQRVIATPARMIRTGQGIGQAFQPVGDDYHIGMKRVVRLYKRARPVTAQETNDLIQTLEEFYPDWKAYYAKDLTLAFMNADISLGDRWGRASRTSQDSLFLHPGATTATAITLPLGPETGPITLDLAIPAEMAKSCPDADGVNVKLEAQSRVIYDGDILPGQQTRVHVPPSDRLRIEVSPRANPSCDHLDIRFAW